MNARPEPAALVAALCAFPGLDRNSAESAAASFLASGVVRVFGYGSLPWKPHTELSALVPARLPGWRRDFSIADPVHRGTSAAPGLTLGLEPDPAASVPGAVLESPVERAVEDLARLAAREFPPGMPAYRLSLVMVETEGGPVAALACTADPASPLHVGDRLGAAAKAAIIAHAVGPSGRNLAYLERTVASAAERGQPDPALEGLLRRARARAAAPPGPDGRIPVRRQAVAP